MLPATPPRGIRCILFDLGSTLWQRMDQAAWAALETAANLRAVAAVRALLPTEALLAISDEALGASLRMMVEASIKHQHHVTPEEEPLFAEVVVRAMHALGITRADLPLGALVYEALRVRAATSRVLYPDALETLATLRARGYLLGIVTNRHYGGAPFLADLEQMRLLDHIEPDHVAISADVGYRKPHPAVYWRALDRLRVTPVEAAMVGDHIVADIYGARQLGLFTVWKPKPEFRAAGALRLTSPERKPDPPGESASGMDASSEDALLFAESRQRARTRYPYASTMMRPDATITNLSDVLGIFRAPMQVLT
jgi:HAD superfamily hydrolase (TIGR01662 family)